MVRADNMDNHGVCVCVCVWKVRRVPAWAQRYVVTDRGGEPRQTCIGRVGVHGLYRRVYMIV